MYAQAQQQNCVIRLIHGGMPMVSFTMSLSVRRSRTCSLASQTAHGLTVSPHCCSVFLKGCVEEVCLGQEDSEAIMMTHLRKGKGGLVAYHKGAFSIQETKHLSFVMGCRSIA